MSPDRKRGLAPKFIELIRGGRTPKQDQVQTILTPLEGSLSAQVYKRIQSRLLNSPALDPETIRKILEEEIQ